LLDIAPTTIVFPHYEEICQTVKSSKRFGFQRQKIFLNAALVRGYHQGFVCYFAAAQI